MIVILQASALWWMIVICFLVGALTCQGIAGWLLPHSTDAPNDPCLPQTNFFDLLKASAAAGHYFGAATPNKYHDKYLCAQSNAFPNTWSSLSSKCCRAVHLILSPSSQSVLHLTEMESQRSLLGRQRAIGLHLGKYLSFRHIRCPVSLWLTNTSVRVFPWPRTDVFLHLLS